MSFSFEHMTFKAGRNRIQFVHLKKPVKYGLAGMAQSKLFDQNLPFVVRDDLSAEGELFACLSQGVNGEAPRIEMTREIFYGFKRGSAMARFTILHELGHYVHQDIQQQASMAEYDDRRIATVTTGSVIGEELRADAFAAGFLGKEKSKKALAELRNCIQNVFDADDCNKQLALQELDLRIAALE